MHWTQFIYYITELCIYHLSLLKTKSVNEIYLFDSETVCEPAVLVWTFLSRVIWGPSLCNTVLATQATTGSGGWGGLDRMTSNTLSNSISKVSSSLLLGTTWRYLHSIVKEKCTGGVTALTVFIIITLSTLVTSSETNKTQSIREITWWNNNMKPRRFHLKGLAIHVISSKCTALFTQTTDTASKQLAPFLWHLRLEGLEACILVCFGDSLVFRF